MKSLWWSFLGRFSVQSANFLTLAILARILGPEYFGEAIIPIFVISFSTSALQALISQTIVSKNVNDPESLGYLLYLGRRLPLIAASISAPIIYIYLEHQNVAQASIIAAISFLAVACSQAHFYSGMLEKEMNFKKVALIEAKSVAFSSIMAVIIAYLGFLSIVLVSQLFLFQSAMFVFSKSANKPVVRENSSKFFSDEVISFGKSSLRNAIVTFFSRNLDNVVVLNSLGSGAAGVYSRVYSLSMFPVTQISYVVSRVFIPKLSRKQLSPNNYRTIFWQGYLLVTSIVIPISVFFYLNASLIIEVIFGSQWLLGVRVMEILALVAILQPLGLTLSWLALSQGRARFLWRWNITTSSVTLLLISINASKGLQHVAEAYLLGNLIFIGPSIFIICYFVGDKYFTSALRLFPPYFILFLFVVMPRDFYTHWIITFSSILFYLFIELFRGTFGNRRTPSTFREGKSSCDFLFLNESTEIWGAENSLLELGDGISRMGLQSRFVLFCMNQELGARWTKFGENYIAVVSGKRIQFYASIILHCLEHQPKSIVYFSLKSVIISPILKLTNRRILQVLDFHDYLPTAFGRMKLKLVSYSVDKVIAVSEFSGHFINRKGLILKILYRPVSISKSNGARSEKDERVIGVIGRVDPDKNLELALDALQSLPANFSLVIRGNSFEQSNYYNELVQRSIALENRVKFEPRMPREIVFRDLDILLVTNGREPMGRTVAESQLLGIPTVVPETGGASELVIDNVTGYKYSIQSVESLCSALLRASTAPLNLVLRAKSEAILRHDLRNFCDEYFKAIS